MLDNTEKQKSSDKCQGSKQPEKQKSCFLLTWFNKIHTVQLKNAQETNKQKTNDSFLWSSLCKCQNWVKSSGLNCIKELNRKLWCLQLQVNKAGLKTAQEAVTLPHGGTAALEILREQHFTGWLLACVPLVSLLVWFDSLSNHCTQEAQRQKTHPILKRFLYLCETNIPTQCHVFFNLFIGLPL